ncbi:Uncharacterised protein [Serratia quinivorans]|uniref:Uncharacterized protein n=1 Tax=Serratia quinivorans TaxID=137545 RepID=A0A379ZZW3_9GAMM|nr:Uncharacterised protein [Serratia quinivorans]SUI70688.1 Uncharacterised protein [Serratia quinivorans]
MPTRRLWNITERVTVIVCRSETLGRDGISAQESVDCYRHYYRTLANNGNHVSNSSFARRHGKSVSRVISDTFDFKQIDTACRKLEDSFSLRCAWEMRTLTRGLDFCGFSNMVDKRHEYGAEGKMAYLVEPLPFFVRTMFHSRNSSRCIIRTLVISLAHRIT